MSITATEAISKLRWYQEDVVNDSIQFLNDAIGEDPSPAKRPFVPGINKNALISAATGCGKTVMATVIMAYLNSIGYQSYFIVSMQPLISQVIDTFDWFLDDSPGVIKAGLEDMHDPSNQYQLAMLQTLQSREFPKVPKNVCFLFDEAHVQFDYQKELMVRFPNALFLGFTATPNRLSKKESLGHLYSKLITSDDVTIKNLVQIGIDSDFTEGLAVPLCYTAPQKLNLNEVSKTAGDYAIGGDNGLTSLMLNNVKSTESLLDQMTTFFTFKKQQENVSVSALQRKYTTWFSELGNSKRDKEMKGIIQEVLSYWNDDPKYALGTFRRFIYFCVSKDHVNQVEDLTRQRGWLTYGVTANTDENVRDLLYELIRDGLIHGLIAIDVLSTGFDVKQIEMVTIARATLSISKFIQMAGRGLRICPIINKKDCVILDQAGNMDMTKHGLPQDYVPEFDLGDPDREAGEAPVKICPECQCVNHASAPKCQGCDHIFPPKIKEPQLAKLERALTKVENAIKVTFFARKGSAHNWQAIMASTVQQLNKKKTTRKKDGTEWVISDLERQMTDSQWFRLFYGESQETLAWQLHDYTTYLVTSYASMVSTGDKTVDEVTMIIFKHLQLEFGDDIFVIDITQAEKYNEWIKDHIRKYVQAYSTVLSNVNQLFPNSKQHLKPVNYFAMISKGLSDTLQMDATLAIKSKSLAKAMGTAARLNPQVGKSVHDVVRDNPAVAAEWVNACKLYEHMKTAYQRLNTHLDNEWANY